MGRQSSERKRAARVAKVEADLRADLERLRVETRDCYDSSCYCHEWAWREISTLRFLLGEDPSV